MSKLHIERIEHHQKFQHVFVKGYPSPLVCPEEMSFHDIAKVAFECMVPWNTHFYEREPTRVEPTDVVLDCGAAEGMFSFLVAPRCKKVFAVDPLPIFTEAMEETFRGDRNVNITQAILSDRNGIGKILSNWLCTAVSEEGETSVEMRTIDSLFLDQGEEISYIKADVEGHEAALVRGAERTIRELKPKLVLTTYHYPQDAREVAEAIRRIDPSYRIEYYGISLHCTPFMLRALPSSN